MATENLHYMKVQTKEVQSIKSSTNKQINMSARITPREANKILQKSNQRGEDLKEHSEENETISMLTRARNGKIIILRASTIA